MIKILVVDNYDSFTYNLVHYLEDTGEAQVTVLRNDDPKLVELLNFDGIVLSPGPGLPQESGLLCDIVNKYYEQIPILGVCLGMQAIVEHFGGQLSNMPQVLHGRKTKVYSTNSNDNLLKDIPIEFEVGRYHSWCIYKKDLPVELEALSLDDNNMVMALRHVHLPIYGLQFHPESVLTPFGKMMINNWIIQL